MPPREAAPCLLDRQWSDGPLPGVWVGPFGESSLSVSDKFPDLILKWVNECITSKGFQPALHISSELFERGRKYT